MLGGSVTVGRLFGIRLAVSPSWFIVFFVLWFMLAGLQLPAAYPRWPPALHWAAGLLASLLFFACVVLHELAHSLVALRNNIPVRGITLFMLGGVSHLGRDAASPGVEFAIALAGPLSSLVLGALTSSLGLLVQAYSRPLADLLFWLAALNLSLGLFNLLPGFPLDGGRLLRALVWFAADDFEWATKMATRGGHLVAVTMMLVGTFMLFERQRGWLPGAIWLILIGWFLFMAAGTSYHATMAMHALRSLLARDVMRRDPLVVESDRPLAELAEPFLSRAGDDPAVVVRDGLPIGLIQRTAFRRYAPEKLALTQVGEVMTPLRQAHILVDDLPAGEALQILLESGNEYLPVTNRDGVQGLVRQRDIFLAIELHRRDR